jgi:hypothetical protein
MWVAKKGNSHPIAHLSFAARGEACLTLVWVQLYGRELLPFDVAKQNVLYATLDLIGLNNLAGVGWIKIANVSESWQWMAPRWVGVANITIHTIRDRTGASMGEVGFHSVTSNRTL